MKQATRRLSVAPRRLSGPCAAHIKVVNLECSNSKIRKQGIFWLLTIPQDDYSPPSELPNSMQWIRGQLECGAGTTDPGPARGMDDSQPMEGELSQRESLPGVRTPSGYRHWQLCCAFNTKRTLQQCKIVFGRRAHCELSRSSAAAAYVWKDATSVGQRFEFGTKPICRNSKTDWESVWESAKLGVLQQIPANIRVVSYRTLRAIAADHDVPQPMERTCNVFWGPTGTGKSRTAWEQAGMAAYCKDPRSKFWCGYTAQENVVIDEFRGGIDIAHMLRWLDRYPVRVEIKGSSRPLAATSIWITSNLAPRGWYPEADEMTMEALLRRLTVSEFT